MPYSRSSSPFEQAGDYLRRSQIPVTISLIAVCAVLFLVNFFAHPALLYSEYFRFSTPILGPGEWISLFTYPLVNSDFLSLVFGCLWLFWIGGSLERSWGSPKFLAFFFLISAASGLGLFIGSLILRVPADLIGALWLPLTSLTVAWATINPLQSVLLWGIVAIQARWIALFEIGVIYFVYYEGAPLLGLFVLLGALAAFLVVKLGVMTGSTYRRGAGPDLRIVSGGSGKKRPLDDAGSRLSLNPLDRYRAWQQRRKLAKLWQKSGFTDRDDDKSQR